VISAFASCSGSLNTKILDKCNKTAPRSRIP
jgi:hypothetical protein